MEGKPVPRTDGADIMNVFRYDLGDIEAPIRLDNGYLKTVGRLTRVGVFNYMREDGSIRRELRLPDDVFRADALSSFGLSPLTKEHPPESLTSKNTHRWQVGTVANPRQDGSFVKGDILITNEDAIKAAGDGKRELSCGYHCDLEETAGVHEQYGRYDVIQRNIRGNHVALVSHARGGSDLNIRLDGTDARMVPDGDIAPRQDKQPGPNAPRSDSAMKAIHIDGVDYEGSEQLAQAVTKLQAKSDGTQEKVDGINEKLSQETARADKATEDLETEKKLRTDENNDAAIQKRVNARVGLLMTAAKILGEKKEDGTEWKLDGMTDGDIRKAVIIKVSPKAQEKIDGADEAYIQARFDQAIEGWNDTKTGEPRSDGFQGVRHASSVVLPDADRKDADSARLRMLARNFKMGRVPLNSDPA